MSRPKYRLPPPRRSWHLVAQDEDVRIEVGSPTLAECMEISQAFAEADRPLPRWEVIA